MPSELYTTLRSTVFEFFGSMSRVPSTNACDPARVRAIRTEDCLQHYGFVYWHSVSPGTHSTMTNSDLIAHLDERLPWYGPSETDVSTVLIDEEKRQVAVRMLINIVIVGAEEEEPVPYEVSWLLEMTEDGRKVSKATEFTDSFAVNRVAELVKIGQARIVAGRK